jgi:hypothetical protein
MRAGIRAGITFFAATVICSGPFLVVIVTQQTAESTITKRQSTLTPDDIGDRKKGPPKR